MPDAAMPYAKQTTEVLGHRMAWVDEGDGPPILLLHGNPTSSYLWRRVIPHLTDRGRCIAPDLIGMGDSDKLPGTGDDRYRFVEHRRYLDALLDHLGVTEDVTLVVHDWGSVLGFDWANRHREAVRAIAYMEAIVQPVTWDDWPERARGIFQAMRSDAGEAMVLDKNVFVERILPASMLRDLSPAEHDVYRAPFATPGEDRRPTLTWPREIPIDGEPADVHEVVSDYAAWLSTSDVPTLFVDVQPGSILGGPQRDFCLSWRNQTVVEVPGIHFVQEDSGDAIGAAIAEWLDGLA